MAFIGQLWLPIILASVIVFILSAVIWMAMPWHKHEFAAFPDESGVMAALKKSNPGPGTYVIPYLGPEKRGDKEAMAAHMKKVAEGPAGMMHVFPRGRSGMGPMMVQSVIYYLVVNLFLAFVGSRVLFAPTTYPHVFKLIGAVAFGCYFFATVSECIWFGRPWKSQWLQIIDAALMAAFTAGTFGWLWPK